MQNENDEMLDIIKQAEEKIGERYQGSDFNFAELLCHQLLTVDPDNKFATQILALIESQREQTKDQALARMESLLASDPTNPELVNNLALVAGGMPEMSDKVEKCFRKAIALRPRSAIYKSNYSLFLKSKGRFEEAEKWFKRAVKTEKVSGVCKFNYATFLADLHRWEEAEKLYREILDSGNISANGKFNLSVLLLTIGNFEEGWKLYESRWDSFEQFKKIKYRFDPEKEWKGQDLKNKKILIYVEQGVGDSIQFASLCKMLKEQGAIVLFEEISPLTAVMRTCPYFDEVVEVGKTAPEHDYHQSVMSLPLYLNLGNPREKLIDVDPSYLSVNKANISNPGLLEDHSWEQYNNNFKIGICWAGNPIHKNDMLRSTWLKHFRKLIGIPNVKLFSLQQDTRIRFWPTVGQVDLCEGADGMNIVDMAPYMTDFNCTAAIIDKMDLVITVDTSVAHLAGAMGKPVWTLLSWHCDWRWGYKYKNTPWYPSMKLFRQDTIGDWDSLFDKLEKEVNKELRYTV